MPKYVPDQTIRRHIVSAYVLGEVHQAFKDLARTRHTSVSNIFKEFIFKTSEDQIKAAIDRSDNYKYGSYSIKACINASEMEQLDAIAKQHRVPVNEMVKYLVNSQFKFSVRKRTRKPRYTIQLLVDESMFDVIKQVMTHYSKTSISKFVYRILVTENSVPYRYRVSKAKFNNGPKTHHIQMYVDESQFSMFTCLNYTKREMRSVLQSRLSRK